MNKQSSSWSDITGTVSESDSISGNRSRSRSVERAIGNIRTRETHKKQNIYTAQSYVYTNAQPEEVGHYGDMVQAYDQFGRHLKSRNLIYPEPVPNVPNENILQSGYSFISHDLNSHVQHNGDQRYINYKEVFESTYAQKLYYEAQIGQLDAKITDLTSDNEMLRKQLTACSMEVAKKNADTANDMLALSAEVMTLKDTLKSRHSEVCQQWGHTLEELSRKLHDIQCEEIRINSAITATDKKITNIDDAIHQEIDKIQTKFCCEWNKLKLYADNYMDLRSKLETLKKSEDSKHSKIIAEYDELIRQKNEEITKMRSTIQDQCARMQKEFQEIHDHISRSSDQAKSSKEVEECKAAVKQLQYHITKLEKSKAKWVRTYERKINELVKDLELQEKTSKIQLKMQRASILVEASTDNQAEICKITNELEEKYKVILLEYKKKSDIKLEENLCVIEELRRNIAFLSNSSK